jgi:hypothetical protein
MLIKYGLLLLGLIGLLNLLNLLRKSSNGSTAKKDSPEKLIISALTGAGYSATMARYFVAVSKFETGNFTSRLAREDNNFFGMKRARVRKTTATGETPEGFAVYPSRLEGVKDILLYLDYFNYPRHFGKASEMVAYMKVKNYFEEPFDFYYSGVKSYLS